MHQTESLVLIEKNYIKYILVKSYSKTLIIVIFWLLNLYFISKQSWKGFHPTTVFDAMTKFFLVLAKNVSVSSTCFRSHFRNCSKPVLIHCFLQYVINCLSRIWKWSNFLLVVVSEKIFRQASGTRKRLCMWLGSLKCLHHQHRLFASREKTRDLQNVCTPD